MTGRITITIFAILCLLGLMAVQANAHTLTINVVDAVTGSDLTFRGLCIDGGGTDRYPLPADSCYFHPDAATHTAWWYATSPCTLSVPTGGEGTVTVRAGNGFEYRPDTLQVEVTADVACTLSLTPLTDMSTLGWYSGDTESDMNHGGGTYTCDETDALYTCLAEGMDAIVCESGGAEFTGTPTTANGRAVFTTYEMRHQRYGHLCPILAQALPESTVWATNLSPCLNDIADSMAVAGPSPDLLILQNHPSEYMLYFRDAAIGSHPGAANWPREAISLAWHRVLDAYDVIFASDGLVRTRLQEIWNSGIKLTATGGTDSALNHTGSPPPGSVKTYAKLDGAFTFANWAEAIRDGHTFATNGPIFTAFTVDGADPGDSLTFANCDTETLDIVLGFESAYPVKRVDYIQNGSRVGGKVFTVESTAWDTTDVITAAYGGGWVSCLLTGDDPGWFVCSGSTDTMSAMTSPVWYTMAGMRPNVNASAVLASERCDSLVKVTTWFHDYDYATFSSSAESTRVLALFAEAGAGYDAVAARTTYTVGSGGDYATIALALAGDADENDTLIMLDGVHVGAGATPIPNGMTIRSLGPDHRDLCTIRNPEAAVGAIHVTGLTHVKDVTIRTDANLNSNAIAAIYSDGGSGDLRCENVRFAHCVSTIKQAGVLMNIAVRGWFKNCVWDSCTVVAEGGGDYPAAYLRRVQDLVLDGCSFINCTTDDDGLIYTIQDVSVDTTEFRNILIANNTVPDMSVIHFNMGAGNHAVVDHITIADNTINSTDGCIGTEGEGTSAYRHSIFSGNSAGPVIRSVWPPDSLNYCNLYGNLDNVAYGDTTGIISVDPGYATTSLDSTRAYMALSGAGNGPNYPRYTADGGYMGWKEPTKLPAPTLSVPANGATNQDDPTLTWLTVAYADSYAVKYGTACGSGTYAGQAAPDTTYTSTTSPNATYYWRVRTLGPDGWGPWSSCYSFGGKRTGSGLMGRLYRRRR